MDFNSKSLEPIIFQLVKLFKYNLRKIDTSKNQFFLSESISLFSWGSNFLIEKVDESLIIYIKPRYFGELDLWNKFDNKLDEISSQILLLEKNGK